MAEKVIPGPLLDSTSIKEATCIHTKKIYDSCQSKDCIEELRLYPTTASQAVIDSSTSIRGGRAELLYVHVEVSPVGFNRGFYTVDLRFFYRICAEGCTGCSRPAPITGLAVFDKRCVLFGSEGTAKIFSSEDACPGLDGPLTFEDNLPTAIVEAVDPLVLSMKLVEVCERSSCECVVNEIPSSILAAFDGEISFGDSSIKRVYLTLGQFSILRMERDSQLLIPVYDYCMPSKECSCESCENDPCQVFQQVDFPVGEFFPPSSTEQIDPLRDLKRGCGCL